MPRIQECRDGLVSREGSFEFSAFSTPTKLFVCLFDSKIHPATGVTQVLADSVFDHSQGLLFPSLP